VNCTAARAQRVADDETANANNRSGHSGSADGRSTRGHKVAATACH
jgi:hypothetical protein